MDAVPLTAEAALNAIADPILIIGEAERVVFMNAAARAHLGTAEDPDIRLVDGRTLARSEWSASERDVLIGSDRQQFRLRPHRSDGDAHVVLTLTPLRNTEDAARLRAAVDLAELSTYEWDPKTGRLDWDARLRAIWGISADAAVDVDLFLRGVHPDDRPHVEERIAAAADPRGTGVYEAEYRVVGIETGVERRVTTRGQMFFEEGRAVRFVGVARDITREKRAEEELRNSHQRMRLALEMAQMFSWETDAATGQLIRSDNTQHAVEFELPAGLPDRIALVHRDDRERVREQFEQFLRRETDIYDTEYRVTNPLTGVIVWVRARAAVRGTRIVGVTQNITETKQTELALRLAEERTVVAIQAGRMYSWVVDMETLDMTYSSNVRDVLGVVPPSTLAGRSKFVHPDDRRTLLEAYSGVVRGESERMEVDYRFIHPETRRTMWLHGQGNLLRAAAGRPEYLIGVTQDITAAKEVERELETRVADRTAELSQSNRAIHALIEATPIAITTVDREQRVERWNAAAARIFGWSADEVIGRPLPTIPSDQTRLYDEVVRELFSATTPAVFDAIRQCKDGKRLDVSVALAPLRTTEGLVLSYVEMTQDITERKELERERESLIRRIVDTQEEERQRIARELHDELGHDLTSLKMSIELLGGDRPPALVARTKAILARIDRSIDRLSFELRPGALDDLGLTAAVDTLVKRFSLESGVAVDVHASSLQTARLPKTIETMLYRALQEALTNVWKHSGATTVSIILDRRADAMHMIIEDDGNGFDVARAGHDRSRFGLLGIRERVSLAGGTFHIESNRGSGTSLFIRVPV